ncbi:MAG: SLC13 family permease [Pseudomonadota bacterium]
MTTDQMILFALFVAIFALLLWGRFRYDVVAFAALIVAVIVGVVPQETAFSGFGHPATIIIALVLVVSRGLTNSGAIDYIARFFVDQGRSVAAHIAVMSGLGAGMSALMNNVGALALLMPVDVQAAEKAKRSPAITLMPLSFATILGGMITLIGTPPNIIISSYRASELGEPFKMFDFAPVGLACTLAGVAFIALIGWRLIPKAAREREPRRALLDIATYLVELSLDEGSKSIGKTIRELDDSGHEHDIAVVAVVRGGVRLPQYARHLRLLADDVILVETPAQSLDRFVNDMELSYAQSEEAERRVPVGRVRSRDNEAETTKDGALTLFEAVVREGTLADGRTAQALRLHSLHGVWLVGISREGRTITTRVRNIRLLPGDILLLMGPEERVQQTVDWLGALPLAGRGLSVTDRGRAALAGGLFAVAIALASLGLLYLPIALAAVTILYVVLNIVPLRQLYDTIEWPVVVLIGSLLPIGAALEQSGGTELLARGIVDLAQGAPAWAILTLIMVVTMTLSDVLNNTATAVIAGPIAVGVAKAIGVNPDPFLMAVAVAASCAFLTPIGHKNNTLIMGPGGYRFGDYWRMGLPLEIVVIAVSVPTILIVWPL